MPEYIRKNALCMSVKKPKDHQMDIERKINEIESKIKRVAAERDDYQHHNAILLDENKQLKEALSKQSEMIRELQERLVNSQQILTGKISAENADVKEDSSEKKNPSEKDIKALKNRIDQYIHEIDKCIEWLQNN